MVWTKSLLGTSYFRPLLRHSCRHQLPKMIDTTAWFHNKRSWLQVLNEATLNLESYLRHLKRQIYSETDHWSENGEFILQLLKEASGKPARRKTAIWLILRFLLCCQVSCSSKSYCIKLTLKLLASPLFSTATPITTNSKTGQFHYKENMFPCGD